MAYLLDTGVLLRLVNAQDGRHVAVKDAIRVLVARQETLCIASQNVAEFCNVATRPVANNGYGWSPANAIAVLTSEVEPLCSCLAEPPSLYSDLKRLIKTYGVIGKQVHDARLAAIMLGSQVANILTLNDGDFRRYAAEGINPVTLDQLTAP
jgi:predicted nucleic acid-binding protein